MTFFQTAVMIMCYCLTDKWQRKQGLVDAKTSSQLQKTEENGQNTLENGEHGEVEDAKIEKEIKKVVPSFEFPRFGRSPGPTPPPSLPSTPDNLSLGDVSEVKIGDDMILVQNSSWCIPLCIFFILVYC